ncbi:MAG: hypothetical protein ACO3Z6_04400 [Pseudomonadales bacterium]
MRAPLTAPVRRRILADLGIEVWRSRDAVVVAAATEPVIEQAPSASPTPAGDHAAVTAAPVAPSVLVQQAERLECHGFGLSGAVLLLMNRPVGREARFARDLLAAAAGNYTAEPERRVFEWPPVASLPGAMAPGAAQRALAAFIDKLVQDAGARAVLAEAGTVEAGVIEALSSAQPQVVVVSFSRLAELVRDGAAKRALWQGLRDVRAAGPAPEPRQEGAERGQDR